MSIRCVQGDELTAQDVYDIWRIRDAVFAVEQQVEDTDADGRDLLATTSHFWLADADGSDELPARDRRQRHPPHRTRLHPP